jgi:ribosomal protein S1
MTTDPTSGPESPAPHADTAGSPSAGQPRGRGAERTLDSSLEAEISAALGHMSVEDLLEEKPRPKQQHVDSGGARGGRQHRTGRVFRIHGGDVFIEFGPRSQGVCPLIQFPEPPAIGTDLEFVVERLDAFEGLLVLSRPGAVQKADWGNLDVGQVVEARCVGMNKGGLEMEVAHHKGFMPAGMVDLRHIPDISVFIGEKFPCEIVELNRDKNRLILSRKAVLASERAEKRQELLAQLEIGQIRPATIISIQPYGAFADLGGVDGLIHISDISHERIKHPSEAFKEGDIVQVKIKKIDTSHDPVKISLSRKDTMTDPLAHALTSFNIGDTVTGKVTRLTDFGAFVELAPGVEGLVHISEVSHERIPTVDKVLKRDEIITCKILQVDPGKKRISLSMKALQSAPERPARPGKPGEADRNAPREEDPGMRKLKARLGGKTQSPQLKGGLS